MITEVILYDNPYADLKATVDSICKSDAASLQQIKIIIADLCGAMEKNTGTVHLADEKGIALQVCNLDEESASFAKMFNVIKNAVDTDYIHFLFAGDKITCDTITAAQKRFEKQEDEKNTIRIVTLESPEMKEEIYLDKTGWLTLLNRPFAVPVDLGMLFLHRSLLENISLDENLRYTGEFELLAALFSQHHELAITEGGGLALREDHIANFDNYTNSSKRDWYEEILYRLVPDLVNLFEKKPPLYVQYLIFYLIHAMFLLNLNHRDKHVYHEEYDTFLDGCRQVFAYIDDKVITNVKEYPRYLFDHMTVIFFMKLKYGGEDCFSYVTEASRGHVYLTANNIILANITAQDVRIEIMEDNENEFVLECSTRAFTKPEDLHLHCRVAGEELPIEPTYRYCHHKYFGHSADKRQTFRVRVPKRLTQKRAALAFYSEFQGQWHVLKIATLRHTARINSEVESAYCVMGGCFIDLRPDKKRLFFSPYWKRAHISREKRYLQDLKKISKDLYDLRIAYWKNYPKYGKKRIWFTFDKLYKGGDCGEYFYKYVHDQSDDVQIEYLITEGVADDLRLQAEGYRPMHFGTKEHKIKFLYADVVAATHPNICLYSGMTQHEFSYFADLFHAKVVCIQHGLAVQQLAFNVNQVYDNIKTFYVASKYEKKNLQHPIYGYQEDMIKLTGIPRFDGLKDDSKKQILIAPTWRSYIAMPPSMGSARPYSPTFHETDYYQIYQNLIDDSKVQDAAKRYGYRIQYLLHPVTASQISDYRGNDAVEILSPVGVSYEKLLTESNLMITDYSGIQFDFAYMRKPILYYHPDKLPPHYEEGGFIYNTQGFGEIAKKQEELVNLLIYYMEQGCQMKDFYRKRADDFFAFDDGKNCERIFKDLVDYL